MKVDKSRTLKSINDLLSQRNQKKKKRKKKVKEKNRQTDRQTDKGK